MSREAECGGVGYKSILILSEMVYVELMHEDWWSLVSEGFGIKRESGGKMRRSENRGGQQFPRHCVSGLFTALGRGRNDHLLGKP